jgi:hypothetical protein
MSLHHPSGTRPELPPPVTFFSIELDTPARDFWECLARLLSLLGALARRRAARR